MIRTLLFISMLFVSSVHASFTYRDVHQQIGTLDNDPVALLDIMTAHINEHRVELSSDECDALVEQLQQVKQKLCWRPGAGLLALPMLATFAAGFMTFMNYYEMRSFQKYSTFAQIFLGSEQKITYAFINSLLHLIVISGAAFLIEAEYRDRVSGLFAKERIIESKIDELIMLLRQ